MEDTQDVSTGYVVVSSLYLLDGEVAAGWIGMDPGIDMVEALHSLKERSQC